jgi:F-type H+-transporting ATPase subunit gamma
LNSLRDIKQRIGNIDSTKQIIRAMDMIASTKLQKVRVQLEGVRPIYGNLKRIAEELGCHKDAHSHIFYNNSSIESNDTLYIVITSDRGLSGSYNANILSKSYAHMNQEGVNEKILVVGSKGYEFFKKRNKHILRTVTDLTDAQVYYVAESIANWLTDYYLSGKVKEVYIAYTHFETVLSYVPYVEKLLPLSCSGLKEYFDRKYEPDVKTFIDHLVPIYLHMNLFRAFSESHTSEQAARMVNMSSAGKNAEEIIEDLTRMFNRKRQAVITQELSEIVGSVSILNKGELDG